MAIQKLRVRARLTEIDSAIRRRMGSGMQTERAKVIRKRMGSTMPRVTEREKPMSLVRARMKERGMEISKRKATMKLMGRKTDFQKSMGIMMLRERVRVIRM